MGMEFSTLAPTNNDNEWNLLAKLVLLFGGSPATSDNARALLAQLVTLAQGGGGGGSASDVTLNAADLVSDHDYQGVILSDAVVVGSPLNFGDVVVIEDGGWVQWQYASAVAARGICVAASANGLTTVLMLGLVRDDTFAFTPGAPLYATESGISATAPSTQGEIVQQVGFALTADIAFIDVNSTYIILA